MFRKSLIAAVAALAFAAPALAQTPGFTLPDGTIAAGHQNTSGAPPVISACGTTPVLVATSNDQTGQVTQGGATTVCTITFAVAWNSAPYCIVVDMTGTRASMAYTVSTTAIAVTGLTAADVLMWSCRGKPGG